MHSVEMHSIVISETIDFDVTLHFSVGTRRDSNEPPLHVAFISRFIPGVCGTSLAVDGVWRGTLGGLWYPLREDARFEASVHPRHLQTFTATHIFLHAYNAACSTHRNTHIRPEGVAWAAMSYAGPRTSPLFGGNGVCGTRSGTEPPSPVGEAQGSPSDPYLGPIRTTTTFLSTPPRTAQHVPRPTLPVSTAYRVLVGHTRVVTSGVWYLASLKADAVLLMWCGSIGVSVQQCPLIIGFFVPFCRRKLSPIFSRRGSASDREEDVSWNFRVSWVLLPEVAFAFFLVYF